MSSKTTNLIAMAQLSVTSDKKENMETVEKFTKEASEKGAKVVSHIISGNIETIVHRNVLL